MFFDEHVPLFVMKGVRGLKGRRNKFDKRNVMYFESWIFGVRNRTIDESSARLDGGVFDLKIAKIKIVVEEAVEQNSSFLKIPENFEWVTALSTFY